jgi:hypothetical protein
MKTSCWIFGLVATTLVLTGCPEKRRPAGSATKPKPAANTPATAPDAEKKTTASGPLAEYGRNLVNAEKTAKQVTGLVTLEQAVRQFEVVEGRFPRNLDELIAGRYLGKLPNPPHGKRFAYDAKTGKVNMESLPEAAPATPVEAAPAPGAAPAPAIESPAAPTPAADAPPTPAS